MQFDVIQYLFFVHNLLQAAFVALPAQLNMVTHRVNIKILIIHFMNKRIIPIDE